MKIKDIVNQLKPISFDDALEYLVQNARKSDKKFFVVTVNTEIVMLARNDREYEKVLKLADLAVVDGIGVLIAGKIFGKSFPGRIHGADLLDKLSEVASKKPIKVGFVGGGKNVALKASECLNKKYPGLKVAFAVSEWEQLDGNKESDILFVAFGSPKQEKWINENLPKINTKVAIGVGGAFDFQAGKVRRAPKWIRKIGLEWLFRLAIQPWRIKRQLAIPKFILLVLRERLIG